FRSARPAGTGRFAQHGLIRSALRPHEPGGHPILRREPGSLRVDRLSLPFYQLEWRRAEQRAFQRLSLPERIVANHQAGSRVDAELAIAGLRFPRDRPDPPGGARYPLPAMRHEDGPAGGSVAIAMYLAGSGSHRCVLGESASARHDAGALCTGRGDSVAVRVQSRTGTRPGPDERSGQWTFTVPGDAG